MSARRLEGSVALVTGGAKGIGRAIALRLAADGADLAINYNSSSQDAVESLLQNVRGYGVAARAFKADVSSEVEVAAMYASLLRELGRLDVLVNNAGITRDALMIRMEDADFRRVIDVNLVGAYHCAREACRLMMKNRSGSIINITSVAGIVGNAGQANYAASKAGLIGLTKSLARELGGRGVRVNAVAPGLVDTDMTSAMPEEARRELVSRIPLRVLGVPGDVANLVAFLASDEASYISGQVIAVDGGLSM